MVRAVLAAEHLPAVLDAVADDAALAVRAGRRQLLDRALEAVEGVRVAVGHLHREGFLVAVTADFTSSHLCFLHAARRLRAARLAGLGFFSTLCLSSDMRSITSAPFFARGSFSGSVISSASPAFTFSFTRFSRSSR